jgi:MFS family permease
VGGALLLVVFVLVERRTPEPVLPLWVLSRRLLASTAAIGLGVGMVFLGATTYVPTFVETLLGVPPLVSGLTLAMLTLGWPISVSQAGRVYLRLGFRATVLIGSVVAVLACAGLALTSVRPSVPVTGAFCFLLGAGLGFVAAPSQIAAQASVGWSERAVVTGANMFARNIGSAVGVALLGALVNQLMRGASAQQDPARFGVAATAVFWALTVAAVLVLAAALAMPRDRPPAPDAGAAPSS